jgi:hypothetical protein
MEKYVNQLVEDLEHSTRHCAAKEVSCRSHTIDDELEESEMFVTRNGILLSTIVGIASETFPPGQKLTDRQVQKLADSMVRLLNVYHFFPDFPANLPGRLKYTALVNIWDKEYAPLAFGEYHIEFCNYEAEHCPFPGYCNKCAEWERPVSLAETVEKMITDPVRGDFLEDVHNYCDRWCERCALSDRCEVYATENELMPHFLREPGPGEDLAENISGLLTGILNGIKKLAGRQGIELTDELESVSAKDHMHDIRKHKLVRMAEGYAHAARKLLSDLSETDPGILLKDSDISELSFNEAMETVSRFFMIIPVKVFRAVSSHARNEEYEDFPKDGEGSAKVALCCVQESMNGWMLIWEVYPGFEDQILDLLEQLQAIKKSIEQKFPGAWSFQRPGIDV